MTTRTLPALALATGLVLAQGCATIIHGNHQTVDVSCDSPRAVLRVDGNVVAPGAVKMRRGEDHYVVAEEPGAPPVSTKVKNHLSWGYVIVDSLIAVFTFPFGLVAPILDVVNGAMWDLEPENVRLPAPAPAPAPHAAPY
jgi:hypothetical protein